MKQGRKTAKAVLYLMGFLAGALGTLWVYVPLVNYEHSPAIHMGASILMVAGGFIGTGVIAFLRGELS